MRHTSGPWTTGGLLILTDEPSTVGVDGRIIHHWKEIAEVRQASATWDSTEVAANARLIASAPELLSALKELIHYDEGSSEQGSYGYEVLLRCKSAIAKAEGRSPEA